MAIEFLTSNWSRQDLPTNLRGLAATINDLLRASKVSLDELQADLTVAAAGSGLPNNLSPYGTIIQTLIIRHQNKIERMLTDKRAKNRKIVVTPELDLPNSFDKNRLADGILIIN
jgi:hypothetical protein